VERIVMAKTERRHGPRKRRGMTGQRRRRRAEREVRVEAVAFARMTHGTGRDDIASARWLGLSVETLRHWRRAWRQSRMPLRARGRPPSRGDPLHRRLVIHTLTLLASRTGLPTLRRCFPDVPRAELIELQDRCRRVVHKRGPRETIHRLRWTRAGSVWALDFSQPPCRIDGCFSRLTAVRDLASSRQLAALPSFEERAESLLRLLDTLVTWHGSPLVIKLDNGPAMRSEELKRWAAEHRMLLLYSPPRTPEYNGAAEAGIGSIATRAFHHAARHGRPAHWTSDDVFAAVGEANDTVRSWKANGGSPTERWESRIAISDKERERFMTCYHAHEQRERAACGIHAAVRLQHYEQAAIDRLAITRALIEHGYLNIRRRRIPLRVSKRKVRRIA
jgi:transposase InsO family protein